MGITFVVESVVLVISSKSANADAPTGHEVGSSIRAAIVLDAILFASCTRNFHDPLGSAAFVDLKDHFAIRGSNDAQAHAAVQFFEVEVDTCLRHNIRVSPDDL